MISPCSRMRASSSAHTLRVIGRGTVSGIGQVEALRTIQVPVLILNGRADAANQKIDGLLRAIPTARASFCDGDRHSAPYQPTSLALVRFNRTCITARRRPARSPSSSTPPG